MCQNPPCYLKFPQKPNSCKYLYFCVKFLIVTRQGNCRNPKMPSIFESEQVLKSAEPLKPAAAQLSLMFPQLEWDLKRAGYSVDVGQFLSIVIFSTLAIFFISMSLTSTSLIIAQGIVGSYGAFGISLVAAGLTFSYLMFVPRFKILSRGKLVDKHLEYMLKDLQIQLTAGIPIFDAMANVAKGGYGECSVIMNEIIQEVQSGESMTTVLDEYGMLSPSEYLRRVFWQIVNAVKTGSDVTLALKAISIDLRLEKENKIKIYGQELNLWGLIYMMAVVVAPSMGVTLLVILSSFIGGTQINERLFWIILFALVLFQIALLSIIRSKRPDIG